MIESSLQCVEAGQSLSVEKMAEIIGIIMEGQATEDQVARLLVALHSKGETVEEIAGAAQALRQRMTPIRTHRTGVIDVVGTGGDGSGTFNISTTAALVTAAAGVPVAKHGNRAMTGRCGSADVLAELGVNIEADVPVVEACLDELGICFCFAPLLHKAMKHVAPIRQKLGTPTLFNVLGPLANPAGASLQLVGVSRPELQEVMSDVLVLLGTERAVVVHGADGLDEVTLGDTTHVREVAQGNQRAFDWTPEDFGLERAELDALRVEDAEQSAQRVRGVLQGRAGPATDVVIANAAAALWTAGRDPSVAACAAVAREAIESQAVAELLAKLVERTNA
ncbi:MAG: anthranilate phosphoribosyltransferase [Pirellulales bacterium]|nr:anthranilate phosphoribosyltransferase [Pirellulales bacterium]